MNHKILSATGHPLTPKESKFIDEYIKTGNTRQSCIEAGYKSKTPEAYGHRLVKKDYIAEEIRTRLEKMRSDSIAEADEIMQYFTAVMRGEVKDQFGLEASLGERTKAAQELAKRKIDIANRVAAQGAQSATVSIVLDWGNSTAENAENTTDEAVEEQTES